MVESGSAPVVRRAPHRLRVKAVGLVDLGGAPCHRPLDAPGVPRRVAPFGFCGMAAAATIGWPAADHDKILAAAGIAIMVLIGVAWALVPWARLDASWQALPMFAFFPVIALLRHAAGGSASGFAPLIMLPVFWLSLYGSRRLLLLATAASGAVLAVPILAIGAPGYPVTEWRRTFIWMSILPIVGFTVRTLVERVEGLARSDPLTGLLNRRAWDDQLERSLASTRRSGDPLSVALLDLDYFKVYNDTRGHLAGDAFLRTFAEALSHCVRATDVVARFGGEEFVVLLPATALPAADAVIARMLPLVPDGQTVSAGVAEWKPGETALAMLGRADAALYQAKSAGRARTVRAS